MANFLYNAAGPQRGGVLASLSKVGKSLRLLPAKDEGNGEWTRNRLVRAPNGLDIPDFQTIPCERRCARCTAYGSTCWCCGCSTNRKPDQKRVWFVIDELASLHRLPQLHTAITENRKSNNPIILGFQGKAQLEVIYGHLAEVMLSQPATKIYLKTKEPKAGKWVSEAIGQDRDRAHEGDALRRHARRQEFHARPADRAVGDGVGDFRTGRPPRLHEDTATTSRISRFQYLDVPGNQRDVRSQRVVEGRQTHLRPKHECHWRCGAGEQRSSRDPKWIWTQDP